jgi:hypothetical protein
MTEHPKIYSHAEAKRALRRLRASFFEVCRISNDTWAYFDLSERYPFVSDFDSLVFEVDRWLSPVIGAYKPKKKVK